MERLFSCYTLLNYKSTFRSKSKISVGRDFKIDAANSVVNLRDIIGQVTNTINKISTSSQSEKSGSTELVLPT